MPRFMAEISHCLRVPLDPAGNLRLDPLESRVGKVKWNADERRRVRAAPLVAQIHGRTEGEPFPVKFMMELRDETLDPRAADGEPEVRDPATEQRLAFAVPRPGLIHVGRQAQGAYRT